MSEEYTKIIVVGKEASFSERIIDYAIDMAERMSYEIIAVSTAPLLSCSTLSVLSHHKDKVCTDFEEHAKESVKIFKQKSEENNINFTHIIKFKDTSSVLNELRKELGGFEFVISEEEGDNIFVYSLL